MASSASGHSSMVVRSPPLNPGRLTRICSLLEVRWICSTSTLSQAVGLLSGIDGDCFVFGYDVGCPHTGQDAPTTSSHLPISDGMSRACRCNCPIACFRYRRWAPSPESRRLFGQRKSVLVVLSSARDFLATENQLLMGFAVDRSWDASGIASLSGSKSPSSSAVALSRRFRQALSSDSAINDLVNQKTCSCVRIQVVRTA